MTRIESVLGVLDRWVGDGLERVLRVHYARRLGRLGWGHVLGPDSVDSAAVPVESGRPARAGNEVTVLIDGEEALATMSAAIAGARSSVHIAGWHASPDFRLTREPSAPTLRELLAGVAERAAVRMLLWAGPPLPVFQPSRRTVAAARDGFTSGTRVRCVLDARERTMHCHHEKVVIVDGEVAFVGGLDFTALQGDRHDSSAHPPHPELGWHDVAVRLRGPIVADVAEHFGQRWTELTGERLPEAAPPAEAGSTSVRLLRTVPERTYRFAPKGEFTILDEYLRALRGAESLIYLENQFLWSPQVVDILVDKLRKPPRDGFRLILLLPMRPSDGADTTRGQLGRLVEADCGAGRLLAATISACEGGTSAPVYVHAKVGIVDDRWLTIGSANLNEHSLFNDTEVNVVLDDPDLVRRTRLRLWSEHLRRPEADVDGDPTVVTDELWRPIAEEQARLDRANAARSHQLVLLPNLSRRAARLQGPLRGLLVDG